MSISSIVNLAAAKIGEILVEEAKLLYGVEEQVESLRDELNMMNSFLIDMDEEGGDERSRTAIKQIRKIAYDAEDVIEFYILQNSYPVDKMEDLFKRYVCFCSSIVSTHQIGSEIEAIKVRITQTMERWKNYLGQNGMMSDASRVRVRRPISYAHHSEDHVVGLDEDINKIIRVLTSDEDYTKSIEVVSFVGMGGSGKTTLARKLYNHECVKKYFDCVAWVSISEQWIVAQILGNLLRKARGESTRTDEILSIEELVEKLHQCLESKRYLIVLDDVWTKQALEDILPTLPSVNNGSKILVTTRKREVIDFPDLKCFIHEPRRLTENESWELFRKIALLHNSMTVDITLLEALGKEMLKKCEGLPLAVVALAGILGKKETLEEWEKIKKAVSSRIMEDGRGTRLYGPVNEMLALSYNDLPCEIKPCFLYLAIFPEDRVIQAGKLIRVWIAEGFITSNDLHEGDTLEDVARGYLDELIHRCVVQIASKNYKGKVTRIRIHDLVRDLCIKKAKQQDFLEIFTSKSNSPNSDAIVTESRRTAICSYDIENLPFPTKSQHLRSLVYEANYGSEANQNPGLQLIHQRFRLLRVLILVAINTCDNSLPDGIGNLIHLRYLGLVSTKIAQLPSSIGNLRNLLTLDYRNVLNSEVIVRIPDVVWKIEGLRHLYLPYYNGDQKTMQVDKLRLHPLKYLQTLWGVSGGSWMLEELPRLSQSIRKLYINNISCSEQLDAAFQCSSITSDRLHSLYLDWFSILPEGEAALTLKNLQAITHCQHLRRLILRGRIDDKLCCSGSQFPSGIMKLELNQTWLESEASLAALGKLPNLVILELYSNAYRGTKWNCAASDFPKLKDLRLGFLFKLEEWSIERGAMIQLEKLSFSFCKKLSRISDGLKFITTLQELQFWYMNDEFKRRVKGGGEDAHIIQHVPLVEFL